MHGKTVIKKAIKDMTLHHSFKQFFTPQKYSNVMINALKISQPKKVIDLAMGEGSLLIEAMRKWENIKYVGNDLDSICCQKICAKHRQIKCFNEDIFLKSTIEKIERNIGKVDLCLGNPPFDLIRQKEDIKIILKDYNLDKLYNTEYIPAELIFILQCLTILKNNGTLALILPDGFFVNSYLKKFRQFLLANYSVQKVIELPHSIFKKTDAKTHVLILQKTSPISDKITISSIENYDEIEITNLEAINRMDYSFYKVFDMYKNYNSLSNLDIQFLRGKSKFLIKDIDEKYILHTTNFSDGNVFSNNLRTPKALGQYSGKIAMSGDIVIARVGSYCLGKIGIVEKGYFVATDCLFILRIKDIKLRNTILNLLNSTDGQMWIKANSKGVAARHITLDDIKRFPCFIESKICR